MLIDSHFHLDLMDNMQSLIRELQSEELGIIAVGTTPKAYKQEKQFCSGTDNINVGLGLHPQLVAEREHEIDLFLHLMKECRFIGEVGLDFNVSFISSKDHQLSCFQRIAKACTDYGGKIISIHSVKAVKPVIEILASMGTFSNNICIFHWFTGTTSDCRKAIEAGAWFSINPHMLETKSGREIIKSIPSNRIVLETDAPFAVKTRTICDLKKQLEKTIFGICEIRGENIQLQVENNNERLWKYA